MAYNFVACSVVARRDFVASAYVGEPLRVTTSNEGWTDGPSGGVKAMKNRVVQGEMFQPQWLCSSWKKTLIFLLK